MYRIIVTSDDIRVCSSADRNTALQTPFRDNAGIDIVFFPFIQILFVFVWNLQYLYKIFVKVFQIEFAYSTSSSRSKAKHFISLMCHCFFFYYLLLFFFFIIFPDCTDINIRIVDAILISLIILIFFLFYIMQYRILWKYMNTTILRGSNNIKIILY